MSNFAGVTFAEQIVTPSDDGAVYNAIFSDGVLSGCGFSYSGATLTMAAGMLMISGRQIRHTAASSWPVVDAVSGYARLVLTIDLTQASTADDFRQVSTEVQYAAALDGFSSLAAGDINAAGTRYQAVLCVVSLGAGGITGIVSALPVAAPKAAAAAYASAGGTGDNLALPKDAKVSISLNAWKVRSSEDFSFSGGGIRVPRAGNVLLFASVYFNSPSEANPANVGPYVHLNGAEVAGHLTYSQSVSAVHLAPVIVPVNAGDVLTLLARSANRDGSCIPGAKMTTLTVVYL